MIPLNIRLCVKLHAAGEELHVLRHQIRLAADAVAELAAGAVGDHPLTPRVIGIVNGQIAALEEDGLGIAVLLHGLMEVQMVAAQIGVDTHGEADAIHAVKAQCVGGDLHHHVGAARVRHLTEQAVQLEGFGGSALGRDDFLADHVLNGAYETHLCPRLLLENALDEVGGGGLAAGARHADHGHFAGGMVEPVAAHECQRLAAVFHHHVGDALHRALHHGAHGAFFRRHGDKFMSIHRLTGDGNEDVTLRRGAGIVTHAGNVHIHICRGRHDGNTVQQVFQFHRQVLLLSGDSAKSRAELIIPVPRGR